MTPMMHSAWVKPGKLLDGFQGAGRVSGNLRAPVVHFGPAGQRHLLDVLVVRGDPHAGGEEPAGGDQDVHYRASLLL